MLHAKQGEVGNIDRKSNAELKDLLSRQEKLLANRAFLKKLPDGGARVQAFADKLRSILEERGDVDGAARILENLKLTDVRSTESGEDSPGANKEPSVSGVTRFHSLHSNVFAKTLQNDSAKFMPNRALRSKCVPDDLPRPERPAVKEKSGREKDITSAYAPPLKKESVKSVDLSESVRLQLDQQKKLEVLRAEEASQRLAERLGIQIGEFTLDVEDVGRYDSTCNHAAALPFKLDTAWRNGFNTDPVCTSVECRWTSFRLKQKIEPNSACEMTSRMKPQFSKKGVPLGGINPGAIQQFFPVAASSRGSKKPSSSDLVEALEPDFKEACVCQLRNTNETHDNESDPSHDLYIGHIQEGETMPPTSLMSLAKKFGSVEEFLQALPTHYCLMVVNDIERRTREQAKSSSWYRERQGRITGSVVHSVITRCRRILLGADVDNTALLKRLLFNSVNPYIPALKYGREMEAEARDKYLQVMKTEGHKLKVGKCGLLVHSEQVYLGASPDGIVKCTCCGKGVLEIKCPFSVSHTSPNNLNIDYVSLDNQVYSLKKSHSYYSQIQLQMAVSSTKWCDFFVYSKHGHIKIRVSFDEERWLEIKQMSEFFFRNYMAREMVLGEIFQQLKK